MAVKLLDLPVRELAIVDGFTVQVRYVPRPILLDLVRRADRQSLEENAAAWAKTAIAGWSGLTVEIARGKLNIPFDDEMAPTGGEIPYAPDTAAALWLYGNNLVSGKIQPFAFTLLETVEKEKADAKND